ncbi:MAG: nucleotidyltransferase domain-containing protein [Patescibacteria group bacterium]
MNTQINTTAIVNKLKHLKPEKIILFGSYARGNPHPDSDVDVLVIQKTRKKPTERVSQVLRSVWGSIPHIEAQIVTPEEFQLAIHQNRFFITQEVLKHGKVIYEKR